MKNRWKIMALLTLLFSAVIYADNTTNTTVTTLSKPSTAVTNNAENSTSQSTTYIKTTSTTTNVIDDDIVSAIYAKYAKDPALTGTALTVSSQNGIVSISGTVTAQSQADEASIAAKAISGVKDVRSTIDVITNPQPNTVPKPPKY